MIVCAFCQSTILESTKRWDYHHTSYSSLQKGANQLCVICFSLHNDIKNILKQDENSATTPVLSTDNLHWPLYRWTIRGSGGTTESLKTIVITLRPVYHLTSYEKSGRQYGENRSQVISALLPDRVFHLLSEADLGIVPERAEDIGRTTEPAGVGLQIKRWLQNCRDHHSECRGTTSFMPTRLVDIGRNRDHIVDSGRVWIVETKQQNIDASEYMTLSHCWGLHPMLKLQTSTRERFVQDGIALSELSTTFQQAIEIARFLGIQYIWIDSLCIIQGSDGDFKIESDLMHKVYRHSTLNIAAADSFDGTGGLFRDRNLDRVIAARYIVHSSINKHRSALFGKQKAWRVIPEDLYQQELLNTVLYTRGWVFQERMLSPRILHFSTHQLFWDCASMTACETLPAGLPNPLDHVPELARQWRGRLQHSHSMQNQPLAGAADISPDEFWINSVEKYTGCNLTKLTDKLQAMWGIAKLLGDILDEEYGAGLWKHKLEEQLAWRVSECRLHERPPVLAQNFPSWSWASIEGTVLMQGRSSDREYFVRNHHGERIRFESDTPIMRRITSFKNATENIDYHLSQWKEKGEQIMSSAATSPLSSPSPISPLNPTINQDSKQSSSKSHVNRDRHPELRSPSIEIQGQIGRARLCQRTGQQKWTLELAVQERTGENNNTAEEAAIDVFPDVRLREDDPDDMICYFVILAWSRDRLDMIKSIDMVGAVEDFNYSGVGIMLKQVGKKGHFKRRGALNFQHISPQMWIAVQATYCKGGDETMGIYEKDRGYKFWLD